MGNVGCMDDVLGSTCGVSDGWSGVCWGNKWNGGECVEHGGLDCEVEECRVCREVGEIITLRRQAEVFGRIQKNNKL